MEKLANPEIAAAYLNATKRSSPENLFTALKNVAQARKMATVAKDAGVQRETLYHSLSEKGNPTCDTFFSVLSAVGITFEFAAEEKPSLGAGSTPPPAPTFSIITAPPAANSGLVFGSAIASFPGVSDEELFGPMKIPSNPRTTHGIVTVPLPGFYSPSVVADQNKKESVTS